MAAVVELTGGAFQSPLGVALADGYLLFELNPGSDEIVTANTTTLLAPGYTCKILLDVNGNVVTSPVQNIWGNDQMTPSGCFYMISAYSAVGQLVWGPNPGYISGTSPVSLNVITPPTFS